jgi:hypothetical protein
MDIRDKINQANLQAVTRMIESKPVWVDVRPAVEVVPGMGENMILHAGPPISWERMCKPQKNAVIGAIIYEGLANTPEEAGKAVLDGRVLLDSNHNHSSVNPMTGVMSASMPVFVVENQDHGNRSFCLLYEGPSRDRLAMGNFDTAVLENLKWIEHNLAMVLCAAVHQAKGIKLKPIMARALTMGDELHNRNIAATCLLLRHLAPPMSQAGLPTRQVSEALKFLEQSDNFFLHLAMPAAKAAADAAHGIEFSTLVTAMTRNGVDFGIRVSGLGGTWFTGPAQQIEGVYFPGYSAEMAANDLGDSAIMETVGLGGFVMAASPEMALAAGGTPEQGVEWTKQMKLITLTTNKEMKLPWVEFVGTPIGIDIRKVVALDIVPIIDTAIVHREGGFIGAGTVNPPVICFKEALKEMGRVIGA